MPNSIEEIKQALQKTENPAYILGFQLTPENTVKLDLSESNPALTPEVFTNASTFQHYLDQLLAPLKTKVGIGGYFEDRMIYRRSEHFGTADEEPRSIHLGVDLWAPTHTPVYAPLEGKIHSLQDNAGWGNYGPTIILTHQVHGITFFSLYGHLNRISLDNWKEGDTVRKGELLAHFGEEHENGNWPPHLHFQLMNDMQGWKGDFPGVCKPSEKEEYMKTCPDPNWLIR